jgi:hypothetical protein
MRGVEPVVMETNTQKYPAQAASTLPEATSDTSDAESMAVWARMIRLQSRPRPWIVDALFSFVAQWQCFGATGALVNWNALAGANSRYHQVAFTPAACPRMMILAPSAVVSCSAVSLNP